MRILQPHHARLLSPVTLSAARRLGTRLATATAGDEPDDSAADADPAPSDGKIEDNWYIVQMGDGGQVVGRMHTSVTAVDGMFESTESPEVVLQRGSDRSAMYIETEVIEDSSGNVRMQRLAHQMGATMTTSVRYVWSEDGETVQVTSSSGRGNHAIVRTEPAPTNPLLHGRHASEQIFKKKAAAGETTVELTTLRPEFGLEEVKVRALPIASLSHCPVCASHLLTPTHC